MLLPAGLRLAIDLALEGVSRNALSERAARISDLYRTGAASSLAIRDEADALAYAVTRLPATYAAVRNALTHLEERCPTFHPHTMLDLGAGPGTASWAAVEAWPQIETITQIDSNATLLRLGKAFSDSAAAPAIRSSKQNTANFARGTAIDSTADLIIASYTLAELDPAQIASLLTDAWRQCTGAIVVVEPGTPDGYKRILHARNLLLAHQARIAVPCPHQLACPLTAPDWCHFVQRVFRSRDHMLVKSAELPFEDEKFSYLVAVREHIFRSSEKGRILAQPDGGKAAVTIKLCKPDGTAGHVSIARRDKELFKQARKKDWGDEFQTRSRESAIESGPHQNGPP